jgi:HlyD family secretion protein
MNELLAWLTGLVAIVIPGFGATPAPSWNGYVEADYVYVAVAGTGTIEAIPVHEGETVARGQVLLTLDATQHEALLAAAEARVAAAEANLMNLTTGSRDDEIEVIRASLEKAEADRNLARDASTRSGKLFGEGLITEARLEQDRATLASAEAAVCQFEAQLKVAELPARDAQQWQAEANLAAAEAEAEKARADLSDRRVVAPVAGTVDRLYFDAGEIAVAGAPLVALLPEGALKVRFYVAEAEWPSLSLGDAVIVSCDGCGEGGLTARLSYFASEPQFTPPVIYSREERSRLTFLAEATLDPGAKLLPGQPVTVAHAP